MGERERDGLAWGTMSDSGLLHVDSPLLEEEGEDAEDTANTPQSLALVSVHPYMHTL